MAELELGRTFCDRKATNIDGRKPKHYIALAIANFDDDMVPCFVCNTEHRMENYSLGCNQQHERFVIPPRTFAWVTDFTSVMLNKEYWYTLEEILGPDIVLAEKANDNFLRQVKNCINKDSISQKAYSLICSAFDSLPTPQTPPRNRT